MLPHKLNPFGVYETDMFLSVKKSSGTYEFTISGYDVNLYGLAFSPNNNMFSAINSDTFSGTTAEGAYIKQLARIDTSGITVRFNNLATDGVITDIFGTISDSSQMFYSGRLQTGSIPNLYLPNLTNGYQMFTVCANFTSSMGSLYLPKLVNGAQMFSVCNNAIGSIPTLDFPMLENAAQMFYQCNKFNGSIPGFNSPLLTDVERMFASCSNLTGTIPNMYFPDVINAYRMFYTCNNLTGSISNLYLPKLENAAQMFFGCNKMSFSGISAATWNINKNITNGALSTMFYNCKNMVANLTNLMAIFNKNFMQDPGTHLFTFFNCNSIVGFASIHANWK